MPCLTPDICCSFLLIHINKSSSTSSSSSKSSSASKVYSILPLFSELLSPEYIAEKCGSTTSSLLSFCRGVIPRLKVVPKSTPMLSRPCCTGFLSRVSTLLESRLSVYLSVIVRPDFFLYSRPITNFCVELEPSVANMPSLAQSCSIGSGRAFDSASS